jgi:hypothetical protein
VAANDRLLVDGLLSGINFDISTFDRYPELTEFLLTLPEDKPPEFEEYHDKPFSEPLGCGLEFPLGHHTRAIGAYCPRGYE